MTWDYLAGFTDGEGWIGICGRGPRIVWGQNDRRVLDEIRDKLEGKDFVVSEVYVIKAAPPKRPNPIHMLQITRRADCERLARILLPQLLVKREACERLFAWLAAHPVQKNFAELDEQTVRSLIAAGHDLVSIASRLKIGQSKLRAFCRARKIQTPDQLRRARRALYEESLAIP